MGTVYAATSTINTSDGTLKRVSGDPDDALLDAVGDVALIVYQYLDAIADKGDDGARLHVGVVAQQVAGALRAHGSIRPNTPSGARSPDGGR